MWCGNSYLIKHVRRLRIKDPKPNYMGRIIFIAVKWFLSYCDSATACPLNFGHGMLPSCWLYTALKEEMSLQPIPLKTLVILVLKDTKSCALNGHFWNLLTLVYPDVTDNSSLFRSGKWMYLCPCTVSQCLIVSVCGTVQYHMYSVWLQIIFAFINSEALIAFIQGIQHILHIHMV